MNLIEDRTRILYTMFLKILCFTFIHNVSENISHNKFFSQILQKGKRINTKLFYNLNSQCFFMMTTMIHCVLLNIMNNIRLYNIHIAQLNVAQDYYLNEITEFAHDFSFKLTQYSRVAFVIYQKKKLNTELMIQRRLSLHMGYITSADSHFEFNELWTCLRGSIAISRNIEDFIIFVVLPRLIVVTNHVP